MRNGVALIALVITVFMSFDAFARQDGAPARALGMSDAVRALGFGTAGLYFNPAAMSQAVQYAIDTGYGYRNWASRHNFHLSLVDSQTNPKLAGAMAYSYSRGKQDDSLTQTHDIRLALSSFVKGKNVFFAYGAGFRYMNVRVDNSKNSRLSLNKWAPTLDVGLLLGINDIFYLGATGTNLIAMPVAKTRVSTERGQAYAPRAVGFGAGLVYSIVHFGVDIDLDLQSKEKPTVSPMVGLELTLARAIALRAGFVWDRVGDLKTDQKRVSAGLGYVSKWVGVDVGYAHDVTHAKNWVIESSIRVFLP
ncbi:hypothetical protein KBB45_06785 [Myxococcota bacterium]|nr:hypothetical protein [Myxococcota bacterium]